ncbi:MAG: PD-(D/E)XK nuclease family protein [Candidatus Pacearchaeota archaeon]|nr:PD-(D/E)XK nuclease family protein [Candidatus Pacearchaeota archaeon]
MEEVKVEKKGGVEPKVYSHSRLWLYENCPEFYKVKYIDKLPIEMPVHMALFLGKAVHDSLEWLYHQVKNRDVSIDELIENFTDEWISSFSEDIRVVNGDEKELYNRGIKFLVDYYTKHYPFKENVVAIERKILFPLDEKGEYMIQGYIDRLDLNNGIYEVHDYKTNAYLKRQEEIDKDRQLALYHLGLKNEFGNDIQVKLIWHFLSFNMSITSQRTEYELEKLRRDTLSLIKEIESTTEWPACGKKFCDWCNFKEENNINYEQISQDVYKLKNLSFS